MLFGLRVFCDNSNAIVSFICSRNTATALCVEMWALLNPTSRRLALGVVSLALGCGSHISLFYISLKVGLHLIPAINIIHLAFYSSSYLYISIYCPCIISFSQIYALLSFPNKLFDLKLIFRLLILPSPLHRWMFLSSGSILSIVL